MVRRDNYMKLLEWERRLELQLESLKVQVDKKLLKLGEVRRRIREIQSE